MSLVGIRPFDEGDVQFLTQSCNDIELQLQAHPSPGYPVSEQEIRRRIAEGYRAPMSAVRQGFEVALARTGDDRLDAVGIGGLYRIDERNRNAEVGVSISREADRGKGLGKEAHLLMISYAFEMLGLHRVYGHVKSWNKPARQLVLSIGMAHEGTMRDHRIHGEGFGDLEVFGVLRSEWPHKLAT